MDGKQTRPGRSLLSRIARSIAYLAPAGLRRSLSGQLLVLTILFVMIAEVLIFVPSIANFRETWLTGRLAAAQIATLALETTPNNMVSEELRQELLANAEVFGVVLHRDAARRLILSSEMPPLVDAHFDLRDTSPLSLIVDAVDALRAGDGRAIRIIGTPRFEGGDYIEIVIDETPLRAAMFQYGVNVLSLSIIISIITAGLVFAALRFLFIRPIEQITQNMLAFRQDPEDASRVIAVSDRKDEVGVAERELAAMQRDIRATLNQKARLAALGAAVSKINHDLRNILASAQLLSDRLGAIDDPAVQNVAPRLFASIDRAIALCTKTLKFGKADEEPPARAPVLLGALVGDVGESLGLSDHPSIKWAVHVPEGLTIDADADQLFRILLNLVRNATQALEGKEEGGQITVAAERHDRDVTIKVTDNGPGIPEKAQAHLFEAFAGSGRQGGTGLGLAIAAELSRAHGGTLVLRHTDAQGTSFEITIPDRAQSQTAKVVPIKAAR